MINDFIKVVVVLFIIWAMPQCSHKTKPVKIAQADVSLSVREDCMIVAIKRRLTLLEAQAYSPQQPNPKPIQVMSPQEPMKYKAVNPPK